jgi:hypothetical protein
MIYCQNCKTPYEGIYCHECGQSVKEFNKPIKFLIFDIVGNVFAFDTRFWKTIFTLMFKPGTYTANYIQGQRARYMSPFRLYIFTSFLAFLLLSNYLNNEMKFEENSRTELNSILKNQLEDESKVLDSTKVKSPEQTKNDNNKKLMEIALKVVENPRLYLNSYIKYVSWSMFLLMPIYGFYLWLFFFKSKGYYYNHLIFAVNQHSFVFLFFMGLITIDLLWPNRSTHPELYLGYIVPIYLYLGNLKLYKKGWVATLFRMLLIGVLYSLTLIAALITILVIWTQNELG